MKQLLLIFIMILLVAGVDLYAGHLNDSNHDTITVSVEGEVEQPGSYELPLYASLSDLLQQCGTGSDADLSVLNPQMILKDHDMIVIPSILQDEKRISINTADANTLCQLDGIGPATAQKIIDYRNEHGLFQSLEELMNVKGIGQSRFEKIRDRICL